LKCLSEGSRAPFEGEEIPCQKVLGQVNAGNQIRQYIYTPVDLMRIVDTLEDALPLEGGG
jgi:hypothetical protein